MRRLNHINIYNDDDLALYKVQAVYSAYAPVYTSMEVYHISDKTKAMQFPRYCSVIAADKTEATQLPKGRVCR